MEDLLQVGVITTTHGVRGEVKVFPTTDDPARFKELKKVIMIIYVIHAKVVLTEILCEFSIARATFVKILLNRHRCL